ncbi:MAG TPA: hypothetical protein VHO02_07435 [Fibrobacteria bacterium]|nr:hypothetical protein [Fibrobacteria bacterium]
MRSFLVLLAALPLGTAFAANLQAQDMLFISRNRNPVAVESDDKTAFVLTEGGVLMYDYRRRQWQDNIAGGRGVKDIAYNPSQNRLLMQTGDGTVLEYNPAFRRVNVSSQTFQKQSTGTTPSDLNGLSLGADFFWLGDGVRDRYNRRADVTLSRVFDYDNLWVMTAGHGPFLGSLRRKELASAWFGLYDSAVTAIHSDGKMVWFGSSPTAGSVVGANIDLTGWRVLPAQQDYAFPNGSVNDIVTWKGFVWFATGQGVVRYDPAASSRKFQLYRRMLGSADLRVIRLQVHEDKLYAGTERGIASLDDPALQFRGNPLPISATPAVNDFCENGGDLWAATDLGLLVLRPNGWRSFDDVTLDDVPEGSGVRIAAVAFHDSTLYWAGEDRVYTKPRRRETRTLFTQDGVLRLALDGDILYAAHPAGVRAYNLKNRLWTDFNLADGIPGTKVLSVMVRDGYLWVGTDYGATRIRVRPYLP